MNTEARLLVDGLGFPEGPRWHDNKLWFSDFQTKKVMTADLDGHLETVIEVKGQPSGLGWLPDQSLLIVSMTDCRLLRLRGNTLSEFADLSDMASFYCNDMVVDRNGRAFVGNMGFALNDQPFQLAEIILVTQTGDAKIVAREMAFPNGSVITPDGKMLIVAETFAARLTAFHIDQDGALSHRRVWAQFDDLGIITQGAELRERIIPDGICLDAEDAIWVASPNNNAEVVRVCEGGKITHRIQFEKKPYACMLGGPDRKTLFVLTSNLGQNQGSGQIETVQVDIPGAGLP